jgi:hypothetical protein
MSVPYHLYVRYRGASVATLLGGSVCEQKRQEETNGTDEIRSLHKWYMLSITLLLGQNFNRRTARYTDANRA